jgi:Secretion system C-terminal sorting domain/Kelch motif/Galactose oxidase, central domain
LIESNIYPTMKTTLFFVAFLLYATFSSAQIDPNTPWTWMKGDNTVNQLGVYGTQGIGSLNNKPGSRNFSTTWRDTTGNLWLFGGMGYGNSGVGYLNDLWKYNPSSNNWTWVKGDNTIEQHSSYGTQGLASPTNKPGATYASVSWSDSNNNLWLFGGFGYTNNDFGFLNTLWKYNPTTNQWTWVKGDNTIDQIGIYGTRGVANAANKPGARYGSCTWTDTNGNLWLFGGYGYDNSSTKILNDLWKYNPASNNWTWVSGDNSLEQVGLYGTKGVANTTNKPGSRYLSTSWVDNNNNLWLFGGYGYDEANTGNLNDLWKYVPSTNQWIWMSGDKTINQHGIYGTQGVPNSSNKPGARYVCSSWTDPNGELWLFGGYGYDAVNAGYLNDLWKYSPATNIWTWAKGDNTVDRVGIYGTQGLPHISNKSGARTGSVSWTDGTGNLWLFGGYGFDGSTSGILNDLWKINSFQILPVHLLQFNGVMSHETVQLKWQAEQEIDFSHFVIQRSFDGSNFTSIGNINGTGNSNRNNYSYNDNDLKNRQVQNVFYRLQLIDKDGSFTYSKILRFDLKHNVPSITTFPNPATNSLNLSFTQNKPGKVTISIIDMKGTIVKKQTENILAGRVSVTIDVSTLVPATYTIIVLNQDGTTLQKFIKH